MIFLEIKLTKYGQDSSLKTTKHQWEKNQRGSKQKDVSCSWIGKLTHVQVVILLLHNYICNVIPTKISARCFIEINKLILNVYGKIKELKLPA